MGTDNFPTSLLPSSPLPSPQQMTGARKPPKVTYGRRPHFSSPSEADKSSATLIETDLSPFRGLKGKDIVCHEEQPSFSSQETRVDEEHDDNDSLGRDTPAWKHRLMGYDDNSSQTDALINSSLHGKDDSGSRRASRSRRDAASTLSPNIEKIADDDADDDDAPFDKFQFKWREDLKKIDDDFVETESNPATAAPLLGESPAESSQNASALSPVKRTARPKHIRALGSDSEHSILDRSRTKRTTRCAESTPAVDQSEGTSALSDPDGKPKFKKRVTRRKQKSDRPKTQKPTKKMIEETKREQAKILAEQHVSVPRPQDQRPTYNILKLATRLSLANKADSSHLGRNLQKTSSDPIQHWSSPTKTSRAPDPPRFDSPLSSKGNSKAPKLSASSELEISTPGDPNDQGSDDSELPELGDIIKEQELKSEKEAKQKKLMEHKQRILEQQKTRRTENGSAGEDDDLEILNEAEKVEDRKPAELKARRSSAASRPRFPGKKRASGKQEELNMLLLKQAERQSVKVIRQKEEDWANTGGKVFSGIMDDGSRHKDAWVEKMIKKGQAEPDGNDGDIEGSDEEWTPDDPTGQSHNSMPSDAEGDENAPSTPQNTMRSIGAEPNLDSDSGENDVPVLIRRVNRTRKSNVVDSDDDSKLPVLSISPSQLLRADRSSISPFDDGFENGTDKENNGHLMFDLNEDKENIIVRSLSVGRAQLVSRSGSPIQRANSPSDPRFDFRPLNTNVDERLPFTELRRDEEVESDWTDSGERYLKRSIGSHSPSGNSPLPQPVFGAVENSDEERDVSPKPAGLQGGFSQFFGSSLRLPGRTLSFASPSASMTQKNQPGLDGLRKFDNPEDFSLTLDVGLQPALEVSNSARQKADSIFEREQGYLLETANAARSKAKPQLYIDENGFLTQNRPESTNPEVYRSPLASTQRLSTQTQRQPLSTISVFDSTQVSPDILDSGGPKRRLKRYSSASPSRTLGYLSSPSPSPVRLPQNAFDVLRKGAARDKGKKKEKQNAALISEFVQAEAQESDEDDGFGLMRRKEEGEEEDEDSDAENDKAVEGLLNDAIIDAETEAKEQVVEKFKEHLEEDDANLEKYHRDAVEGKFRTKRRNRGVDFEDSDSELDDEEARELRRRIAKKRKIEGDTLDELAKNEETLPFVQAYENGLKDDDMLPVHNEQEDAQMSDGGGDDNDENGGPQESISIHEIREQVRQRAREKSEAPFDPSNISWLEDRDDEEHDVRVRTVSHKKTTRSKGEVSLGADPDQLRFVPPEEPEYNNRLNTWAKANGNKNNSSLYVSSGCGSVTARPKTARTKPKTSSAGTVVGKSKDQKLSRSGSSMLSAVSNRRNKFGS